MRCNPFCMFSDNCNDDFVEQCPEVVREVCGKLHLLNSSFFIKIEHLSKPQLF